MRAASWFTVEPNTNVLPIFSLLKLRENNSKATNRETVTLAKPEVEKVLEGLKIWSFIFWNRSCIPRMADTKLHIYHPAND